MDELMASKKAELMAGQLDFPMGCSKVDNLVPLLVQLMEMMKVSKKAAQKVSKWVEMKDRSKAVMMALQ